MIIPSLDLMDGKAVKLVQGNPENKKFEVDAIELAKKYSLFPVVNVIDLDAAFGDGDNLELIQRICKICSCNVGGGIRDIERTKLLLKFGARKLIIGTNIELLKALPIEKTIAALDSKKGKVVDQGWNNQTAETTIERARRLKDQCSEFLYTYVDKEGTMQAMDIKTVKELKEIKSKIMYAGGIGSFSDIQKLENLNVDSVIGMAAYEKKIGLKHTFVQILKYNDNGLIPTIVQEESGQVLMLAYSSKESLNQAFETKKGWYFSRSKQNLWMKGESSGNIQELKNIKVDCDKDTLLFTVKQKNNACHRDQYSCFDSRNFDISYLYSILKNKRKVSGSYTNRLLNDSKLLYSKILEEAKEVVEFKSRKNLVWELADIAYFLTVLMVKKGIQPKEVLDELCSRNKSINK